MNNNDEESFELLLKQLEIDKKALKTIDIDFLEKKMVDLIDYKIRREKGQFPTPKKIAKLMAKWSISHNNVSTILDPAIGCGILVKSVLHYIFKNHEMSNLKIYGFDIDPMMITASKINLSDYNIDLNLFKKDFLFSKSDIKFDLIIGNPPYIKSNKIKNRDKYHKNVLDTYNIKLNGNTGLYVLFLIHSINFLKDKGKLAFIIPSEFLNAGYGEKFKKILLENLKIYALIYFEIEDFVFDDGMSSSLIILAEKKDKTFYKDYYIRFLNIKKWNKADEILEILESNDTVDSKSLDNKKIIINANELDPNKKWIPYFSGQANLYEKSTGFIPLSNIFYCKRGIATGANSFFTLTESEINKWNIDSKYISPVLSKANFATPPIFTDEDFNILKKQGKKVLLLNIKEENPKGDVIKYLNFGEKQGFHLRYLTRTKKVWYFIDKRIVAPILVKVFNRGRIQFILNKSKCLNLTSFHGIYPIKEEDLIYCKLLILYFHSKFGHESTEYQLRHYGGGLKKLEPRDVEKINIPNFHLIDKSDIEILLKLFEKYANKPDNKQKLDLEKRQTIINKRFSEIFEKYKFFEDKKVQQSLIDYL